MSNKMKTQYIIKQFFYRSFREPTIEDKRFLFIFYICWGVYVFLGLALVATALSVFGWLMYAAGVIAIIVGIVGVVWRIRDIVRQMRGNN